MTAESQGAWAGWYRDRQGAEAINFTMGERLVRTRIRGVDYEGADFAHLQSGTGEALLSCVMEWDMPLPVTSKGGVQQATLSCLLTLREPGFKVPGELAELSLTLRWGGAAYESGISGGDFEEALTRIRRQLPTDTELGGRSLVGA